MSTDSPAQPKTLPKTSHNSGWGWTASRYRAAAQIADGTLTLSQIAKQAGITRRQLTTWRNQPEFIALVNAISGDAFEAIRDEVVSSKAGRLRILVDLHNKLLAVIEARMAAHADERPWAAGESTGLVVTKESWGNTDSREAQVDIGLVKQIQSLHEQIVKEQRDWDTSVNVRHSGRIDHVHRNPDLKALSDDEIDRLEELAQRAHAGAVD